MAADVHPPMTAVREAVARALTEDLTPLGDLTSALLPAGTLGEAAMVTRSTGVVAGCRCAGEAFAQVDPALAVTWSVDDGDPLAAGQELGRVQGPLASLLTAERTALNFLGHLSGVASLARRFVDAVAGADPRVRIWDTRKTTPGLRALEKAAVRAGGGANHRGNLSDWVLLKDNHLAALGVADAVERARRLWPGRTVHVECDDLDQLRRALAAGADAVLLDNFTPEEVARAVKEVDAGGSAAGAGPTAGADPRRCLVEVSGGVTLETVADYAAAGPDLISVGALTSSAPVLDIGLDIVPTAR